MDIFTRCASRTRCGSCCLGGNGAIGCTRWNRRLRCSCSAFTLLRDTRTATSIGSLGTSCCGMSAESLYKAGFDNSFCRGWLNSNFGGKHCRSLFSMRHLCHGYASNTTVHAFCTTDKGSHGSSNHLLFGYIYSISLYSYCSECSLLSNFAHTRCQTCSSIFRRTCSCFFMHLDSFTSF